jgi:hypothetical protein
MSSELIMPFGKHKGMLMSDGKICPILEESHYYMNEELQRMKRKKAKSR